MDGICILKIKRILIDSEFNKIIDAEYDYVNTFFADQGIYLFGNIIGELEFNEYNYADLDFVMINYEGNIINENIDQIYSEFYKMEDSEEKADSDYNNFIKKLKSINNEFVGDKFYQK